jgi:predicted HTH domain antitoxin
MLWSADWAFAHLTKLHKQQPKLVDNALQKMIEDNPDLAWSLVVSAYLDEEINLGKAAEMLGMHELELRDRFIALGIPLRIGPLDKAEARAEAHALSSWFSQEDTASTS